MSSRHGGVRSPSAALALAYNSVHNTGSPRAVDAVVSQRKPKASNGIFLTQFADFGLCCWFLDTRNFAEMRQNRVKMSQIYAEMSQTYTEINRDCNEINTDYAKMSRNYAEINITVKK